ncbi:MAG: hypothetical protein ACYCOU_16870 [Sulfobacillus sp.]
MKLASTITKTQKIQDSEGNKRAPTWFEAQQMAKDRLGIVSGSRPKRVPSSCVGLSEQECVPAGCNWIKAVTRKDGRVQKAHCAAKPVFGRSSAQLAQLRQKSQRAERELIAMREELNRLRRQERAAEAEAEADAEAEAETGSVDNQHGGRRLRYLY